MKMIKEYDHVKIKKTGITGIVVDVYENNGNVIYTIESDKKGVDGGYGEKDQYKLFDCKENDLEVVNG